MRMITIAAAALLIASCSMETMKPGVIPASTTGASVKDAQADTPTLLARAILPSDAYQAGPPSGAFITGDNGVTPPFPGQPIPGFSAILDAGNGEFWAMPDNGYGW